MMGNRVNRSRNRQKKKWIIIAGICFFIICAVIIGIKFISERNVHNIQVGINNNENEEELNSEEGNNSESVSEEESSEGIEDALDNSNYLELESDPNADDATIVAENTKGLLNGSKTYPVRTDGKKVVYLTFDDGPSTTNTPQILDVLDKYSVKATFFVLGKSLESSEDSKQILKDIATNGHAIANHSYSHDYSYLYPNRTMNVDNIVSDMEKSNNLMKEVLGKDFSTRVIRFPGGYWSWEGRTAMRDKMIEKGYCNMIGMH